MQPSRYSALMLTVFVVSVAHAEAPMNTDDAGTLDKSGMKVEAIWSKDDKARGLEALFGFSVVENLEMEVAGAYVRDTAADPATRTRGVGFGAKWVSYRNDSGWSLGVRFDYGHNRVDNREVDEKFTGRKYALTGLASYRLENGHQLHLNLGTLRIKAQGESDTVGIWGVGYDFPIVDRLQLTVEAYGEEHSRPDKAIGLRCEVFDGFKVSGAIGRGNDRNFGQAGVAWEF